MSSSTEDYLEQQGQNIFPDEIKSSTTSSDDKNRAKETKSIIDELEEPNCNRCLSKGVTAWRIVKPAIFVVCVTFFLQQSAEFYELYFTYPTTTRIAVTRPKRFKKPAITFCNSSPMPRSHFCSKYPHLCEQPNNLTEFCQKHSYFCTGNYSDLRIPKLKYYAEGSVVEIRSKLTRLLFKHQLKKSSFIRQHLHTKSAMKNTFVSSLWYFNMFENCFSANLHLYDGADAETDSVNYNSPFELPRKKLFFFKLYIEKSEIFYPWEDPHVLLSVHSPFIPTNPVEEGSSYSLEPGYSYTVEVSLEEEHLLPHPYQTNCTDYEAEWRKNNKAGPRSQEICMELCHKSFYKTCSGCEIRGFKMYDQSAKTCPVYDHCSGSDELLIGYNDCLTNCRTSCLKLKYLYSVSKRKNEVYKYDYDRHEIVVAVSVRNPEVIVMSHHPLYGDGEMFSYIGGLMGCWLGVSVWAFIGILETTLRRILLTIQVFRRSRQSSSKQHLPPDDQHLP